MNFSFLPGCMFFSLVFRVVIGGIFSDWRSSFVQPVNKKPSVRIAGGIQ
jgi:hypothetical protein